MVAKNEKEDRPIGIPTTEDKILQRAVSMILEPIYEQEFLPFSFGFRPGRSQHQALEYLREQCFAQKVQWILEVDLRKFFDTVDHRQMRLEDVHKVQRVIAKRFARFGLKINTEKTRLVRFGRPSRAGGTGDKPETFELPRAPARALRAACRQAVSLRSAPWLHPLLGDVTEGQSGGDEENRQGAVPTDAASDQGMGDGTPSPVHEGAAAQAQ
jgi:hypothetical protein